jgi:hypothetical protein
MNNLVIYEWAQISKLFQNAALKKAKKEMAPMRL